MDRRKFIISSATAIGTGILGAASLAQAKEQTSAKKPQIGEIMATAITLPRKMRLCDDTIRLATKAVTGGWGSEMRSLPFKLEDKVDTSSMSEYMKYAQAVRLISENAPLRYETGMRLIGSATVLDATSHIVPLYNQSSVSHTTIGYEQALKSGIGGIRAKLEKRLLDKNLDATQRDYLESMRICLDAYNSWHKRNMELAAQRGATQIAEAMKNIPEHAPSNFFEGVLSLHLLWAWTRLCGNWSGIGRFDKMLGPLLTRDLNAGKITLDEARELVAHFWLMGSEWIRPVGQGSGDAQFYQNIVLGGIDEYGREITNPVTYLVLDVVEELRISDFPIAVRLNEHTPDHLIKRIAQVQRLGGGIIATYNEPVIIQAMTKLGYPLEEARNFTNDGCWEVLVPGKTAFTYIPFDTLQLLQDVTGTANASTPIPQYANFDALYSAFEKRLAAHVKWHHEVADGWMIGGSPAIVPSIFVEGCIENAADYNNRGAKYYQLACHAGGIADTANSLMAIKQIVFDAKLASWSDLVTAMRTDWKDKESLRHLVASRVPSYGNDNTQADAMAQRVYNSFTSLVAETKYRKGVFRPAGISTFGREIEWSPVRKATANGHHAGDILATNFSPSPGSDKYGPTAALCSYCKMDYTNLPGIGAFELKLLPASVKGDKGIQTMVSLLKGFQKMGGCFLHIDVVDSSMLVDAQKHPDKYPNLSVRVAGWSARFATLNKQWQDMIINRTQQIV